MALNPSAFESLGQLSLASPVTPSRLRVPQTYAKWVSEAKDSTKAILANGCSSPLAWVFVQGTDIPANAIIAGDDRGRPLYFARTFYERTIQVGKAARHFENGAKISYSGVEVDVPEYEVLVGASVQIKWTFSAVPTSLNSEIPISKKLIVPAATSLERNLKDVTLVVLVDDSLSMRGNRWNAVREVLGQVAELAKGYDANGLDLFFLNNDRTQRNIREKSAIHNVFEVVKPSGQTPTGARLRDIFNLYIPALNDPQEKPVVIIVITDGEPTDDLEDTIVTTAKDLEQKRVPVRMLGVQFIQIGDDEYAAEALKKLDDDLAFKHNIRDVVTATVFDKSDPEFQVEKFLKVLRVSIEKALYIAA